MTLKLLLVIVSVLWGIACASLASERHRGPAYFFLGATTWLVGVLIVFHLPHRHAPPCSACGAEV